MLANAERIDEGKRGKDSVVNSVRILVVKGFSLGSYLQYVSLRRIFVEDHLND